VAPHTSPLAEELAAGVLERFLRYVRVDTQAARTRSGSPSTPGQLDLARILVEELRAAGLTDAALDGNGYVMATLPGDPEAPVIGLLAHMDTSPDAPGAGVEPIVHSGYDGGRIELPRGGTVLDPEQLTDLQACVGYDIVTSSGDTLLGADDKAGVAEIMAAVAHLAAHPELPRPTLRIGFTPDEEIGEGATLFDIERFGAYCAYTLDGSTAGEIQDETFSGIRVEVRVKGVDIHPGFATGRMVNASRIAGRIIAELPQELTPEATAGRDGFIHVYEVRATAAEATIEAIVRDFDDARLASHVEVLRRTAEEVVASEPRAQLEIDVEQQYPNMRKHLEAHPNVSAAAERAIRAEGLDPIREPIRGGTDGSMLSARGLPTPNVFAGGHAFHSVREWVSAQDMASAAAVVVRLAAEWASAAEVGSAA
jgi:tripeptide aminopeptidase